MKKCFEVIWIFQENSYNAQKRGKLCIYLCFRIHIFKVFFKSVCLIFQALQVILLDCFEFSKEILIKLKLV